MPGFTTPLLRHSTIVVAVFVVALAAACHPGGSGHAPGARRCQAPKKLPGSQPLAPQLEGAIADADVPAEALIAKRRVCNRLALEAGTFARQHALDVIDWRPWSPQVLVEAGQLHRPVLVLSGFAASASCSRLGREVLAVRRLAREINQNFVPVLLDSQQRPDVDAYVMQAAEVLTGGAGWPVVAFLQSDGRPFEAYSWGAKGSGTKKLDKILQEILRRIALGGGTITERAELTSEKMLKHATIDASGPLPDAAAVATDLHGYLARSFDAATGSFGEAPLFPRAPVLDFLLRRHAQSGDAEDLAMATAALASLHQSALFDGVAGGFHRYARQPAWKDPAWEKLLADNAALASVFLDAAAATGRDDFRDAARATVEFLLTDLRLDSGAFAASLDAMSRDSDGNPCEGCFYAHSEKQRAALPPPARDETVLADANALAISALLRAATVLGQPRYREAAIAAADVLDRTLRKDGRVIHCAWPDGRLCTDGYLSDQALTALAFLDLDATAAQGETRWLDGARAIADRLPERFEHQGSGGFFLTGADAEALPLRYKPDVDAAYASGNSAAAMLYVRLAARTGEPRYREAARRTLEAFSEVLTLRPMALPSMASALMEWSRLPGPSATPASRP